jgi:hypothetical protein
MSFPSVVKVTPNELANTKDGNQRAFFYFWNQLVTVDIKKPCNSKTAYLAIKLDTLHGRSIAEKNSSAWVRWVKNDVYLGQMGQIFAVGRGSWAGWVLGLRPVGRVGRGSIFLAHRQPWWVVSGGW